MKLSLRISVPARKTCGISGVHRSAIDRDGLAGDEIAVHRSEENQSSQEVWRVGVALDRAALNRVGTRAFNVTWIILDHAVAQREPGSERVHADAILADGTRERPRECGYRALRGNVMHHLRDAAEDGA